MSILGRDGNISVIRVATIAAIVGLLVIVSGVAFFFIDRASHQRPFEIDPYPGAALWFSKDRASNSRQVVYRVQGATADEVAAYYQQKLEEIEGNGADPCLRFPSVGNYEGYNKNDKSSVPYRYSCLFDRSGFQISQFTRINIEPGIESNNSVGMVVVENEQYWQR